MTATQPALGETLASRRPSASLWAGALCFVVALHAAGFAFALAQMRQETAEDALGAATIEISLDLTAPHEEQTDLPPGPAAEESAASAAAVEQTAKMEETDLPKDKPVDADDPDRIVAPEVTMKPKDDTPTIKESKANAAAEAVASEAAAPPNLEAAPEAPRAAAPVLGSGESLQRVRTTWQKDLVAHLNRFKRYPATGSRHAVQIIVAFTLDRRGHIENARIQQGSGDPAFDKAALAMMTLANPVPAPPPLVADEGLAFSIPVIFRDRK